MSEPTSASGASESGAGGVTHAHHWLIKSQDGPSSEAVCKQCGESRDFVNGYKWQPYYRPLTSAPPE